MYYVHNAGTVASTAEGKKMFGDPVVIKVHCGFASFCPKLGTSNGIINRR